MTFTVHDDRVPDESEGPIVVGFTHQRLLDAFYLVADPADWKLPARKTLPDDQLPEGITPATIAVAVEYFTSTSVQIRTMRTDDGGVKVRRYTAPGYYERPAGP
jgi:hypothetical protein